MWYSCHLVFPNSAYSVSFSKCDNSFSYFSFFHNGNIWFYLFGLGHSLEFFMTFLSSIFVSFFTFYDKGLCILLAQVFLFFFSLYKFPFRRSIDNTQFGIELLIVRRKVSQLSNSEHSNKKVNISLSITTFIPTNQFTILWKTFKWSFIRVSFFNFMFTNFFSKKILFPTGFYSFPKIIWICFICHMMVWRCINPLPNVGNCFFVHLILFQVRNILGLGFFKYLIVRKSSIMEFLIAIWIVKFYHKGWVPLFFHPFQE